MIILGLLSYSMTSNYEDSLKDTIRTLMVEGTFLHSGHGPPGDRVQGSRAYA